MSLVGKNLEDAQKQAAYVAGEIALVLESKQHLTSLRIKNWRKALQDANEALEAIENRRHAPHAAHRESLDADSG